MSNKSENHGHGPKDESKLHQGASKNAKGAGEDRAHEQHGAEGKHGSGDSREQYAKPGQPGRKSH
jgi:hypothetical protein